MHQMQWQGHTECPSPSLSNPTEATNAREENERKNKKENTKISSLFSPQNEQESMEGLRVSKLEEGQQWGKNTSSKDKVHWGRRPPYIVGGTIQPLPPLQPRREWYYRLETKTAITSAYELRIEQTQACWKQDDE